MIDRLEFYHGAALLRVIQDQRCLSITTEPDGYIVNREILIQLKYTTKAHSPWRFTFGAEDARRLANATEKFPKCFVGLVCGGDGVCVISSQITQELLGGGSGWIAVSRRFSGSYSVSGPHATLRSKVALNEWPDILFEDSS